MKPTPFTDIEAYLEWEALKDYADSRGLEDKISMEEFAKSHGYTLSQIKNKIYRGSKIAGDAHNFEEPDITVKGGENERTASSISMSIKNVEELRAANGMSEDEWEQVGEPYIKTWNGFMKDGDGKPVIVQLWSVRAAFRRLKPEQVLDIMPRRLDITYNITRETPALYRPIGDSLEPYSRTMVLFDAQIALYRNMRENRYEPVHDRRALDIVSQIAEQHNFDNLVIGGDWNDFPEQSTHFTQEPRFSFTTEASLVESAYWLTRLVAANWYDEVVYLEGNHEERMKRIMLELMPHAYGLRNPFKLRDPAAWSAESLLGLDDLGIKYADGYPNNIYWLEDDLAVIHGNVARAKYGVLQYLKNTYPHTSVLMGHTHRPQEDRFTVDTAKGKHHLVHGVSGALCRLDHVVPGHKIHSGWQQGFYEVFHNPAEHHVIYHQIQDGRCLFDGQVYVGKDDPHLIYQFSEELGWKLD